jgi:hypothetical protein
MLKLRKSEEVLRLARDLADVEDEKLLSFGKIESLRKVEQLSVREKFFGFSFVVH